MPGCSVNYVVQDIDGMLRHALPQVLAASPVPFGLELASSAGSSGLLNLDAWLADYSNRESMTAVPAILRYLMEKTAAAEAAAGAPDGGAVAGVRGVPLTADAARAFLKVLQASAQGLPVELLRELQVRSCIGSSLVAEL